VPWSALVSDFITPREVNGPRKPIGGSSSAAANVQQVTVRFDDPQFGMCRHCGSRIARLGDQEPWHHVDRMIRHRGGPAPSERAE
jgi:hypothetical protein